ncbi:MAG: ribosome assembly cofactor RimP [Synechococcus sp. SB0666_bin_14]|nr:ribosome assembly cofactor RimP [Synechococcus sp. SB0666_bin_14]MYA90290.1 ribosome assembly cofactor RimP [Synechococcus sp. SB0663_bin_10]MYG47467.1 ribosome assembly cofactor RimP [Synechococcus sp. SB0675_bin_6]MYJ58925.1 ribosome assembly cofactor RimP [Synechococcus sp. SB0672_bin_6]MYK91031.1 ribosome assembly cofactor RimP [Synechococcus sp. SB0669_bin_8]
MAHALIPTIRSHAETAATSLALVVSDVAIQAHRQPLTVVVAIRRLDGDDVSIVDCEQFSHRLGAFLDEAELFTTAFVLEVSSPGLSEDLVIDRDFQSFRGFPVELHRQRQGRHDVVHGTLMGRDETAVWLNRKGRITRIPRGDVLQVRLTTGESG